MNAAETLADGNDAVAARLGRTRRRRGRAVEALCVLAMLLGLLFLASILWTLLWRGLGGLGLHVFVNSTRSTGENGGLLNAIVGSLLQTALGMGLAIPVGLLAGTYLAEYARGSAFGNAVRFVSDMLLSAPSVLVGLFVYTALALPLTGFSGWAGGVALAVIAVPIIVRTTEDMLRLIPVQMREAAMALGAPKWRTVVLVCYRAAREGIMTGILLAVARVAGETAPLLFTSLGNSNFSADMNQPIASLPLAINTLAGAPEDDLKQLAWTGALIVTAAVLATNLIARAVVRRRS